MINRWLVRLASMIILSLATQFPAQAQESAAQLASRSLKECEMGRHAQAREARLAHFEEGQAVGEQAVQADESSAAAHFALFCNLGEQLRIDGEANISSMLGFRRVIRELDRTLELQPNHLDALSAKGTFLVRLPALLGGDHEKGEEILRHVIQQAPKAVNARLSLAKSYSEDGRYHEAVTLASEALTLAQSQQRNDFIPEARAILSQLRAKAGRVN